MALDKQKILNELESVVNQLQSANCGCLGNVFNQYVPNSHQQLGYTTSQNCGHNYHGSTCGHIPSERIIQGSCGEPSPNVQSHGNCTHHQHPTNAGSTARSHFDPAIVQPIVNEVYEELKTMTPENTIVNSPIANHLGLPIAQDSHNTPHKCNTVRMPDMQKAMENAKAMQAMGNEFMHAVNMTQNPANNELVNAQPNSPKLTSSAMHDNVVQCQNCRIAAAVPNNVTQPKAQPILQHQSPYGQHAHGMAKFQELFPGVMGNGDLGFDPMEVAIKMNPNNQQNALNSRNHVTNACHQQSAPQVLQNPDAHSINMPLTNASIPTMDTVIGDTLKGAQSQSHNGLYRNEQQVYQASPRCIQEKVAIDTNGMHRPFHPTAERLMNEVLSGSQAASQPGDCNHVPYPITQAPQVQTREKSIEYNTLGQPVEIMPAEIYRKPEETLPQTLSPQPSTPNNYASSCMKGAMNKDHVISINKNASNTTPCLMANPMSYGTHSDGQLNTNFNQKNTNSFIERTVGDTVINNKSPRPQVTGDKPLDAQPDVCTPEKLTPNSARKHRNGLQDIVFTSYPKSTKWSFHGNARKTSAQRPT